MCQGDLPRAERSNPSMSETTSAGSAIAHKQNWQLKLDRYLIWKDVLIDRLAAVLVQDHAKKQSGLPSLF